MFPTRISFLTYNLWNKQRWPQREPALHSFLQLFRPDIFCLQELRLETRTSLDRALPDYQRIDDPYMGWTLESNIYWSASLLDEVSHGVEDIAIKSDEFRGLFWARLRVIATGQTLLVSTAHYTFQEHPYEMGTGQSPRLKQAEETIQALNRLAEPAEAVFFMGDFNDPVIPTYKLAEAGYLSCFVRLGLVPPPTWPSFPTANITIWNRLTTQTIDWIVSNDRARPISALSPHYYHGDFSPSDHWPVLAVYEIPGI
jgi:endonuclease/exonuclease/phosphatase family metal-dependent hydrolase